MKVRSMLALARIYKEGQQEAARDLAKAAASLAASCGYAAGCQEASNLL